MTLNHLDHTFSHPTNLLDWKFSQSVLVTAFDLFKEEQIFKPITESGLSLKIYLHFRGFSPDVKIFADTGIYEVSLQQHVKKLPDSFALTPQSVISLYQYMEADYYFIPDELVLLTHPPAQRIRMLEEMVDTARMYQDALTHEQHVPVLQGLTSEEVGYSGELSRHGF